MRKKEGFSSGVGEFIRYVQEAQDAIYKEAGKRVATGLIRKGNAPIGDNPGGEFLSHWNAAVNQQPPDIENPVSRTRTHHTKRLKAQIEGAEYGGYMWFRNPDPVSIKLEVGYSDQAPNGIVRLMGRRWRKILGQARYRVKQDLNYKFPRRHF